MPASLAVRAVEVEINIDHVLLPGTLALPEDATGIVVFAHGSGSSRFSPRNQQVAEYLNYQGLGTLLFDLLTAGESEEDEETREYRFNIPLLSHRLVGVVDWLVGRDDYPSHKLGLFGASTGAAAALIAAAERPGNVAAVVSRGGRPDLAGETLAAVTAPTLLIVGSLDAEVITLNEQAAERLVCKHRIAIVPGASHLFPEPGKLEEVCRLSAGWFQHHLG